MLFAVMRQAVQQAELIYIDAGIGQSNKKVFPIMNPTY